jgi:hypothetical protein
MDQFDIIGGLRTYCDDNGIEFIWQKDQFYANMETGRNEYTPGQLILVVDLKPNPTIVGAKVSEITYTGLFMLGRKFDSDNKVASLDEKALQKYDRRLLQLSSQLVNIAAQFSCANELTLTVGAMDYIFNGFDANIDFSVAQSITFVQ